MSHIIKAETKINMTRLPLLKTCVEEAGGTWLGKGNFNMFMQNIKGIGFSLPRWKYPICILENEGTMLFDDYGGLWGDKRTLQNILNTFIARQLVQVAQEKGYSDIQQTEDQKEITIVLTRY